MPDPITPQLPDPQASVDAALGTIAVTPPVETPVAPAKLPMGDDTPLAFAAPTLNAMPATPSPSLEPTPTPSPVVPEAPKLEPMPIAGSSYLPPVPPAPITTPVADAKPKKKLTTIIAIIAAFFVLGIGGLVAYSILGNPQTGTIAYVTKWIKEDGKVIKNPDYKPGMIDPETGKNYDQERAEDLGLNYVDPSNNVTEKGTDQASCNGCLNGGWQVWRNGECKITGSCGSNIEQNSVNPNIETSNDATSCGASGGTWCGNVVDTSGASHAFCGPNNGEACYQLAIDRGITMSIGKVECDCKVPIFTANVQTGCSEWGPTQTIQEQINNAQTSLDTKKFQIEAVNSQCSTGGNFSATGGTQMFICPKGTTVACTALNGKPFYGNSKGCFCGTIQVDTSTGHQSYSSTCGCDQEVAAAPSAPPAAPVLACTGLTQTPVATPTIGQTVTFTCAGTITPAAAATLSYKFRYSLDNGTDQLLTNTTATTAQLAITACGTYSVQCKVCATIAGVLTCDPTWTGAVQ